MRYAALVGALFATALIAVSLAFGFSTSAIAESELPRAPGVADQAVVVGVDTQRVNDVVLAVESKGGRIGEVSARDGYLVVEPPPHVDAETFGVALADEESVRFAEPLQVVEALMLVDDPGFAQQWNLVRVGCPEAWNVTTGTADVSVAVLDTGVDFSHPDLVGRLDARNDWDFIDADDVADDDSGHGTHVAGIIAANTGNGMDVAGVAPGITLLPVRILNARGSGDTVGLARGIRWAADKGASVINLSLGFSSPSSVVEDAIGYARSKGCLLVAASGNSGTASLRYPAAYPEVLAVGATDAADARATFSQYGSGLGLVAPGVGAVDSGGALEGILSLRPVSGPAARPGVSTGRETGTSVAAPHVAAAAALLRSAHPTWTATVIANKLLATAENLGPAGKDAETGYGLLRVDRALGLGEQGSPDDDWPGVALVASPLFEIIDETIDPRDVFFVEATAGEVLRASLTGASDARTEIRLLGPDATTIDSAVLATALSTGAEVSLSHQVPDGASGTYRLVISALRGGGEYRLAWGLGYPTRLTLSAPSTCAWGGSATLSGRLVRTASGLGVADVLVAVDQRAYGATGWKRDVESAYTDVDGGYRVAVAPRARTEYRIRFDGDALAIGSLSAVRTITPRPYLSAPVPQSSVRRGEIFNVQGTLKPEHRHWAKDVKVTVHRRESGRWVWQRTTWARNLDRRGFTRYSAWLWLPQRGQYRLVASIAGDSVHTAASSKPVYVTVR